jgi:hypothetical protein
LKNLHFHVQEKKIKVDTSSTSHREFQRRKDKTKDKGPRNQEKKTQKQHE